MVMALAAPLAAKTGAAVVKKAVAKATGRKTTAKKVLGKYHRRRVRLLTLGQREELMWVSRHLGRTAAAERMMHFRR